MKFQVCFKLGLPLTLGPRTQLFTRRSTVFTDFFTIHSVLESFDSETKSSLIVDALSSESEVSNFNFVNSISA